MSVAPEQIIEAVKKMGGSEEMANDLVQAVQSYVAESEEANQAKFKNILNKAKALCVDYVEQEILKNARKLQVYIESKEAEFAEVAERTRKLEESQAAIQLKKISSLLGGNVENPETSVQLEALQRSQGRLEKAYVALKEENMRLATASSRANTIAERAIEKAKAYRSLLDRAGLVESEGKENEEGEGEAEGEETPKEGAEIPFMKKESEEAVMEARKRRIEKMRMIGESRIHSQRPMTGSPMASRPVSAQQSSDPVVNQIARNIAIDL